MIDCRAANYLNHAQGDVPVSFQDMSKHSPELLET
jgi:hypothetical protein